MTRAHRGIGEITLKRLKALETGDVLYLADDEQEAEALAAALTALATYDGIGLVAKGGRWLLEQQTDEDTRAARVTALLEDVAASRGRP